MVIKVSEIDDEIRLVGTMEPETLSSWRLETEGFRIPEPVRYALILRKEGQAVNVQGTVDCTVMMACSRCLDECELPLSFNIDMELEPKECMPTATELEVRGHEMDVGYFENDEIDLVPIVDGEILLNLPMMPLCGEDCKGLCEVCGINKNHEGCLCDNTRTTMLAEKLKSFLN